MSLADRDAWIAKPQPTPEMCRLVHGVDCRQCVGGFSLVDKLVTLEAIGNADRWRRDFDERQQRRAELERRVSEMVVAPKVGEP